MKRYKILIGATIILLALLALSISVSDPISTSKAENETTKLKTKRTLIDLQEVQRYALQQQELRLAIKKYFDRAIAAGDVVGAGVSIVKGDSVLLSDGFGKKNAYLKETVDNQTIFRLGSLSKGFAGILAADLQAEGKISLADKVCDYLPEFQLGDARNTDKITLANILSHSSGAPYHSFTNLVEAGLPMSTIAKRFKEVVPISDPGALYSYQNALFALFGEITYKATGQEIKTTLEERFFLPLGMCSTTMEYKTLSASDNVAMPHSKRRRGWRPRKLTNNYYNAIAAGGINASAFDMAIWMRFLLGKNPKIMSKQALKTAFNPFIEITGHSKYYQRWPGHQSSHYAFGWRIHKFLEENTREEKTIWHHGGSVNDYRNEIAVYPEADLGICVLLNNHSRIAGKVIPDLYKIVREIYSKGTTKIAGNSKANTLASP